MFRSFMSAELQSKLLRKCVPVAGVPGLQQLQPATGCENVPGMMDLMTQLHRRSADAYARLLTQRTKDREFIDRRNVELAAINAASRAEYESTAYRTVIGDKDESGRVVVGPLRANYFSAVQGVDQPVSAVPPYLAGPHVTLFAPPTDALTSVQAVNCFEQSSLAFPGEDGEPKVVERLVGRIAYSPKWGADAEDSTTPLRHDLVAATDFITRSCDGTLTAPPPDGRGIIANVPHRALPIRRIPGLAMPCMFMFVDGEPVPLHIYDLALHLASNFSRPEALCFYVPKLENEEEAAYVASVLRNAEEILLSKNSNADNSSNIGDGNIGDINKSKSSKGYEKGSIRVITVIETPRAIYRVNEIMDALHPYMVGVSLGWHDFIAGAARLMSRDPQYRVPVKCDPNIVVKYIQASHHLVANVARPRNAAAIGGMFGQLVEHSSAPPDISSYAFQVVLRGFFTDVLVQLRRGLNGFWLAHPDFMRLGVAIVEAWRIKTETGDEAPLRELVASYVTVGDLRKQVLTLLEQPDVQGLPTDHPNYGRKLIAADVCASTVIANNDPREVRYNVFQCIQYMVEWLRGRGCVALPATVMDVRVLVLDDLATTERSRWEVWNEIHHGRFDRDDFLRIAREEYDFIKHDREDCRKAVQVKFTAETKKWYDVAFKVTVRLMTDEVPMEWVTELLLPFTLPHVREADDPWAELAASDPVKFKWDF